MHQGGSSPEALPALLKRQGSFSEDVISHKGDLRFVTISGQKVLDTGNSLDDGREASATGTLVKAKLKDATERYITLDSSLYFISHIPAIGISSISTVKVGPIQLLASPPYGCSPHSAGSTHLSIAPSVGSLGLEYSPSQIPLGSLPDFLRSLFKVHHFKGPMWTTV